MILAINIGSSVTPRGIWEAFQYRDSRDVKREIVETNEETLDECWNWILNHTKFTTWLQERDARLLWIHGGPGKGKTTMMTRLITKLFQIANQTEESSPLHPGLVLFFFCRSVDPGLTMARSIIKGLIYLLAQHGNLVKPLQRQYESNGHHSFAQVTLRTLWNIFREMLEDCKAKQIYIVIDALDECDDPDRKLLLNWIGKDVFTHLGGVKWILTSRPAADIKEYIGPTTSTQRLNIDLDNDPTNEVSSAVEAYIAHRTDDLTKLMNWDTQLAQRVRSFLKENSENSLLYASRVCARLRGVSKEDVVARLERMGDCLDDLYDRMLKQLQLDGDGSNGDLRWSVIRTVILTYRSLHLDELQTITDLPEHLQGRASGYVGFTDAVQKCGCFLTTNNEMVYLSHKSIGGYMTRSHASRIFGLRSQHAEHSRLAQACLDSLLSNLQSRELTAPESASCTVKLSQHELTKQRKTEYSRLSWIDHVIAAGGEFPATVEFAEGGRVYHLMKWKFLAWVEAIGWDHQAANAIQALQRLSSVSGTRI